LDAGPREGDRHTSPSVIKTGRWSCRRSTMSARCRGS
jgi:hypothetical protein